MAGLSDEEVRRLVLETEGRVLNRLVLRTDGRGMSVDCGHGTVRRMSPGRRRVLGVSLAVTLVVVAVTMLVTLRSPGAADPVEVEPLPNDGVVVAPPADGPEQREVVALDVAPSRAVVDPGPDDSAELLAPDVDVEQRPSSLGDVHLADVTTSWSKLEVQPGQLVDLLESQLEPVRRCYGEALNLNRHYRGTLTTHLSVTKDGAVSHVSMPQRPNKAANARLEQCVETALKRLRFEPRSSASVSFRLVFAGAR